MKRTVSNLAACLGIVLVGTVVTSAVVMARRAPEKVEVESRKITNVTVQVLREKIVRDSFTVTGSLEPWKEVLLSAETSGKIEWQGVDEGDRVERGQELLKIDRVSTEIRLNQARARYELSLLELERMQKLQQGGLSTSQRMDQVRLDRDLAPGQGGDQRDPVVDQGGYLHRHQVGAAQRHPLERGCVPGAPAGGACGHHRLSDFNIGDLTTWKKEMAELTGVAYGGVEG